MQVWLIIICIVFEFFIFYQMTSFSGHVTPALGGPVDSAGHGSEVVSAVAPQQ